MQAVCSTGMKGAALTTRPNRASMLAPRTALRAPAVCQAQARPALAAAAALPALIATHPVFAIVDERLAGEGTGKILGVGSYEFWPIIIVFGLIWALYYSAGKDLDAGGRGDGDDSGLSL